MVSIGEVHDTVRGMLRNAGIQVLCTSHAAVVLYLSMQTLSLSCVAALGTWHLAFGIWVRAGASNDGNGHLLPSPVNHLSDPVDMVGKKSGKALLREEGEF